MVGKEMLWNGGNRSAQKEDSSDFQRRNRRRTSSDDASPEVSQIDGFTRGVVFLGEKSSVGGHLFELFHPLIHLNTDG